MKLNKTLVVCIAMACVLALGGVAFAKNRVEVKVTSEPVPENSTCSKAGGFSLEWDSESVIEVGDQITLDLDYITPSLVTLCNSIDIYIAKSRTGNTLNGWLTTDRVAVMGYDADTNPIYFQDDTDNNDQDLQILAADTGETNGIYFHVYGSAGSRRVTIDVMGDAGTTDSARIIVGGNGDNVSEDGDTFVLQFFDQKVDVTADGNASPLKVYTSGAGSIYHDDDGVIGGSMTLDEAIILENTFCINVSNWDVAATSKGTWNVSMDTAGDVYTFIPSNPQIAHIEDSEAEGSAILTGCKEGVGTIPITTIQGQQCIFDYEEGTGYCMDNNGTLTDHTGNHRIVLQKTTSTGGMGNWDANFTYSVEMEILVTPAGGTASSGDHGVYWINENIGIQPDDSLDDICNDADDMIAEGAQRFAPTAVAGYGTGFATGSCSDTNTTRRITNATVDINVGAADPYIWIDTPQMAFNSSTVSAGDQITIRTWISGTNLNATDCATASLNYGPFDRVIGTIGPCGQNFSLVYQYLTDPSDTNWASGIAITNIGEVAGEADIYYYESDMDMAVLADVDFTAREIKTWGTSAFLAEAGLTTTFNSADGVLGDAPGYIVVCSDFNIDGFALLSMYNLEMEISLAQGYAARQPVITPDECE